MNPVVGDMAPGPTSGAQTIFSLGVNLAGRCVV